MRGFIILDFGSQFTQLIARRLREMGFYSEIHSYQYPTAKIVEKNPYGIILSGGPNSVYEAGSPKRDLAELTHLYPTLGICYGMQLLCFQMGGEVLRAQAREYGSNNITWSKVLGDIPSQQKVWMSHGDVVERIPLGFELVAKSDSGHPAAILSKNILAVQFHPEVSHTEHGQDLLQYFAVNMCHAKAEWTAPQFKKSLLEGRPNTSRRV